MGLLLCLLVACLGCSGRPAPAPAPPTDSGSPTDAALDAAPLDATRTVDAHPMAEPCSPYDRRLAPVEPFTGPTGLQTRLVNLFGGATASIDITVYQLNATAIVAALTAAARRGVTVRVVLDGAQRVNAAPRATLEAAGVQVTSASMQFSHYHPKTLVIDNSRAVIMSANLNDYSMATERNYGVVLTDRWDIEDLSALFDHDQATLPGSPAALMCTRLITSPDASRREMQALIARAATELRVQHLSMTDRGLQGALAARAAAGVRVRVILADPGWITSNTASAATLRAAGIEVRFLSVVDNHAKLIVVDDAAAMVGSQNGSWTSLERNREVGVVLTQPDAVVALRGDFDADWAVSR